MSTLSVPLTDDLLKRIDWLVENGLAANRSDAARKAIKKYIDDQVVAEILRASKEPSLKGNLRELARKFR